MNYAENFVVEVTGPNSPVPLVKITFRVASAEAETTQTIRIHQEQALRLGWALALGLQTLEGQR